MEQKMVSLLLILTCVTHFARVLCSSQVQFGSLAAAAFSLMLHRNGLI